MNLPEEEEHSKNEWPWSKYLLIGDYYFLALTDLYRTHKWQSEVWDLLDETIEGTTCKSCGKSFSGTTLTSSLKRHLAKHQMSQPDEQPFDEQTADHLIASFVICWTSLMNIGYLAETAHRND